MTTIVGIYLVLLAVALVAVVFHDHRHGHCELLSIRNVTIAGFILFQLTSAAVALFTGDHGRVYITTPVATSLEYAAMLTVFIVIMLWVYRRGWVAVPLAHRLPTTGAVPNTGLLLAMAVVITILAVALRFGVKIPLIGILTGYVGTGFAAVACGLVGWVWGRQLFNPALALYSGVIVAANFGVVMAGIFGRRGLVAVGAALLWGMYYSHWRNVALGPLITRLGIVSIAPFLVLALFTSARHSAQHERSVGEHLIEMRARGNVGEGVLLLLHGQYCASLSMWLIETHPEEFEPRHLMTVWHFLVFPVPRAWWPGKPDTLGERMPKMAAWTGIGDLNVGPGIIGHAAAEGGWYALIVYALCGGLFLRFFDETVRRNPNSPFVVLAVGCSLGQILGLCRGVTSSFSAIYVLTVSGALLAMVVIGRFLERTGWARHSGEEYESEEYWDAEYAGGEDPYAEGSGHGDEER